MKPKICFPRNVLTVSSYIFSSTLFSGEWWRIYIKCIAGCEVFTEKRRKNTVCSLCWVVGWIDFWSSKIDICHVAPNCFITAIQKCCFFKGTELPAFNIFFLLEWFFLGPLWTSKTVLRTFLAKIFNSKVKKSNVCIVNNYEDTQIIFRGVFHTFNLLLLGV